MVMMEDDICIKLGNVIKKARIEAGLSIKQLSQQAEVNEKTLYKVESGKANPLLGTLLKIANSLNLSVSELVGNL